MTKLIWVKILLYVANQKYSKLAISDDSSELQNQVHTVYSSFHKSGHK